MENVLTGHANRGEKMNSSSSIENLFQDRVTHTGDSEAVRKLISY